MTRLLTGLRRLPRLLAMVPLEGTISVLALVMLFAGVAIEWGIARALVVVGSILLLLEFGPGLVIAARKR